MRKPKARPYPEALKRMMGEKSNILSKAHTFSEMGMPETAQPLWASAAAYEERIAPQLDILGRELEAAVHRISAATCLARAGDPSRAANLYQAALAGPLAEETRREVEEMLAKCLTELAHTPLEPARPRAQPATPGAP